MTNAKLDDLQFSSIMDSISHTDIPMPDKITHYFQYLGKRARSSQNPANALSWRFTSSPSLRKWDESHRSDIMMVRGSFRSRQPLRAFCWELVRQLRTARISILFAPKTPLQENAEETALVSCADVLRYLIRQVLQITQTVQTEGSMALTCTRLRTAADEASLFQILEAVLSVIPGSVYILVDLELLSRGLNAAPDGGFSWLRAFLEFFRRLAERKPANRVNVMLLSYSDGLPFSLSTQETDKFVLKAESAGRAGQGRRGKKRAAKDARRWGGVKTRGKPRFNTCQSPGAT